MRYSTRASGPSPVADPRPDFEGRSWRARFVRSLLPALAVVGAGVVFAPSDASAAPRCTSKPAVCARIAAERSARPQPAPVVPTTAGPSVARNTLGRCASKPIVCARLEAQGGPRAPQPPTTLALHAAASDRCTSKPAVCARLKIRPKAAPMTLAAGEGTLSR